MSKEELAAMGGRILEKPKPQPKPKEPTEAQRMAKEATARAEAAEKAAVQAAESAAQQMKLLQDFIRKMPQPEGAPDIVGLEVSARDADGFVKTITVERDKKRLN